jgi:hypothetical protein
LARAVDPTDARSRVDLVDPQWNLISLDHSMACTGTLAQPYVIGQKLNQIDRPFFDRVKALDRRTVERALGALVDGGAIDTLVRSSRHNREGL